MTISVATCIAFARTCTQALTESCSAPGELKQCSQEHMLYVKSQSSVYMHDSHMQVNLVKAGADALHLSNMTTEP